MKKTTTAPVQGGTADEFETLFRELMATSPKRALALLAQMRRAAARDRQSKVRS